MNFKKILFGLISFFAFLAVLLMVEKGSSTSFDSSAANWMHSFSFLRFFGIFGTELVIGGGSIALIIFLWSWKKDYYGIALLLVSVAGGNLLNKWLKGAVMRERPAMAHGEEGYSFTSGHAMVGIIFYLLAAFFIAGSMRRNPSKKGVYIAAGLLALLTGLSRIVTYAHYPTDVIGGYFLGFSVFMFLLALYEKLQTKSKRI
ncbi:phosphatase PAP2 family protein [Falsibacillus pallidus]|uniref:phosphatase PAP2 family protein n=1 Tax=Falsibacillus pallidus TaxID=493781 RepID=UPI003D975D2A